MKREACLYALNTLKATMVEYDSKTTVSVNGAEVVVGGSEAKDMENKADKSKQYIEKDEYMQFAEKYFTDLKLNDDDTDDFWRPANTLKGKEVRADLGDDYDFEQVTVDGEKVDAYYVDGELTELPTKSGSTFAIEKNNDDAKVGGNGVLTEVYNIDGDDDNDDTVRIVSIKTWLAEVSGDYDEDDEELELVDVDEDDVPSLGIDSDEYTLSSDDFANLDAFEDEDYVLVTIAAEDEKKADTQYVESIVKAEKVTATVTSYTVDDSVTAGGTKYGYNATFEPDNKYNIKDEYDLYLDTYGNVIYTDGVSADDNVVYISQAVKDGKLTGSKVVAAALFLDGSYKEITLNKNTEKGVDKKFKDMSDDELDATRGWYSFQEKSNGSYDLTKKQNSNEPATKVGQKITEKDSIKVAGYRATSKTQFVVTKALDESGKAYTGIKNVPAITNPNTGDVAEVSIVMDGNYAKYVLIVLNDAKDKSTAKSGDLVYILESAPTDETVNEDEDTIYTYDAIVNGKVTSVDVHQDADNADALAVGLYEDVVYTDKVITDLTKVKADGKTFDDCEDYTFESYDHNIITQKGSVVTFKDDDTATGNGYYLADNAKIMVVTVKADKNDKMVYDEVKTVTAKKLVSDYSYATDKDGKVTNPGVDCTVTGVLDSDGNFTYLFVDLHH